MHILLILSLILNIVLLSLIFCRENFKVPKLWEIIPRLIPRKRRRHRRETAPPTVPREKRYTPLGGHLQPIKNVPPDVPQRTYVYRDVHTGKYVIADSNANNIIGTIRAFPPSTSIIRGNPIYADNLYGKKYTFIGNLQLNPQLSPECPCPVGYTFSSVVSQLGSSIPSSVSSSNCYNPSTGETIPCQSLASLFEGVNVPIFWLN